MFLRVITFLFLMTTLAFGQSELKYIEVVKPKPFTLSPNICFIVDASSSINQSDEISAKFEKAWRDTVANIAGDELYFCIYTFHDKDDERFRPWTEAGGPAGEEEFSKAKRWIKKNTGTYSHGQKAIAMALRQMNGLTTNRVMQRSLSIILITDGGFTEAAHYALSTPGFDIENDTAYQPIFDEISKGQAWRDNKGLFQATIRTIGIENNEVWSLNVKRSDAECQGFLKRLGIKYWGGYYLVKKIRKNRRVS